MIKKFALKYIFQEAVNISAKFLKERKLKIDTTDVELEKAISSHINIVDNWSKEISFSDLKKAKLTSEVYIDVDISQMPRKKMFSPIEIKEIITARYLFNSVNKHLVILGQPGAGKTTLMKHWCQSIILDGDFYPDLIKIPLLIRLKDLNDISGKSDNKNIIINSLMAALGLKLAKKKEEDLVPEEEYSRAKEALLISFLSKLKPLIILDGFDEATSEKLRKSIIADFSTLSLNLNDAIVVMTCRSSDYNYNIENTTVLEICPLDDSQIKNFAIKWLEDSNKATDFLKSLKESPFYDTAIRPLTISHLCAIYERIGKIPDKPKTVYKKIVNLLLEEWDEQRGVKRLSAYGNFEVDRKFEFLCRISFEITGKYNSSTFNERILKEVFKEVCGDFSLEKNEAENVVKEIESHTGLILQSSYKQYEFAHKSLHEYLCAEHLVKLPSIPLNLKLLSLFPNELAISTTISSNPSLYFCELILKRFFHKDFEHKPSAFSNRFFSTFVNRLVLEKPDFNSSKDVSFALVVLYTLFRRGEGNQLRLFVHDNLPIQFEKFVSLIFERNAKFDFSKYYKITNTLESESSEPVYRLRLTINKQPKNEPILPAYIFAKKSFLYSFE
jgi:hypothetical protein